MSNECPTNIRRRTLLAAMAGAAISTAGLPLRARAQGLSKRPIRLIVPTTPASGPDIVARILAPRIQARWDQPVVVENHVGASGAIGAEMVTRAQPDGQVMLVNVSTMFIYPNLMKVNFDVVKSFQSVIHLASTSFALAVLPSFPANNMQEFIAYVKTRPGQLHYASAGTGTHHHLSMELLKLSTGLNIVHVPYKGTAGATSDLLGGQIEMMMMPIHVALPMQKGGKIKLLGESMRERHPLFPELPSISEQGVRDYDVDLWLGLWGPAGLPADIVAKYNALLREILAEPETREKFVQQGLVIKTSTPEELARSSRAEFEKWGKVVREAKVSAD